MEQAAHRRPRLQGVPLALLERAAGAGAGSQGGHLGEHADVGVCVVLHLCRTLLSRARRGLGRCMVRCMDSIQMHGGGVHGARMDAMSHELASLRIVTGAVPLGTLLIVFPLCPGCLFVGPMHA